MKNQLYELFSLKSIITLSLTITLCYLTYNERLQNEHFLPIVTMVFTYYFTRQKNNHPHETEDKSNNKDKSAG